MPEPASRITQRARRNQSASIRSPSPDVTLVLGLPLLGLALGMSALAYSALAGLTVSAVPQVIAAASPLGAAAIQMSTLVKLLRVLMLGPVCLVLSVVAPRLVPQVVPGGDRCR